MEHKFIAFDIEIAKPIPEGTKDWREIRPLGISCAATQWSGSDVGEVFYHGTTGTPMSGAMTKDEVIFMLGYLKYYVDLGYTIVTWNGLSFDFNVLAEESGEYELCKELALNHIDMMFQFLCSKGYRLGLNAAAKGMGLAGKTEGMHGDLAPIMWAAEKEDRLKVLEYVAQDVRTTLDVAELASKKNYISWVSKKGRWNYWYFEKLLTVKEALLLPEPDTSWMSEPTTRASYMEWIKE